MDEDEQKAADEQAAKAAAEQATKDAAREDPIPKPGRIRLPKPPAVGPGNEPAAALTPDQAADSADEDQVLMVFSKEVILTDDQHRRVRFPIGMVNVPAHLADHWYLKASGARRAGDTKPQSPTQ